jgi:3-hydroxy-9,10-secoandrosta-1,3,5(10)-triene-9,17-dione monooxygenase
MTVTAITPPNGSPQPPEPGLTPTEVIARAEAIASTLVARQAEVEERTYYAADVHDAFSKAGFYRILVPRRYGGYEFGVDTFMRVVRTLARGCPSTGWMYCLGAVHAVLAGTVFEESVQEEIFSGGDFICPSTVIPAGTAERHPDGGWIIDGTWSYCSGAPYATHFIGHTLVFGEEGEEPEPMLFVVSSDQFRRLDDWGDQLGLKGSGSHSLQIDKAHVPDSHTLNVHQSAYRVTSDTPGLNLHINPQYGGGPLSFTFIEAAVLAVGIAQGALDEYEHLLRTRTTTYPPITGRAENPDFQRWYGEATGKLATAEAAVEGIIAQWQNMCVEGPAAFTPEREWRLATMSREVIRLSWSAVEQHIFPTAGSSAIRHGQRIERAWRDLSTMQTHAGVSVALTTMANHEYTKARLTP